MILRRLGEAISLRRAVRERAVVVTLDELRPRRKIQPYEPRITGDERFRERDEGGAVRGRLRDEGDRLVRGGVEIEEYGRGLNGGGSEFGMRGSHRKSSLSALTVHSSAQL